MGRVRADSPTRIELQILPPGQLEWLVWGEVSHLSQAERARKADALQRTGHQTRFKVFRAVT